MNRDTSDEILPLRSLYRFHLRRSARTNKCLATGAGSHANTDLAGVRSGCEGATTFEERGVCHQRTHRWWQAPGDPLQQRHPAYDHGLFTQGA